MERHEDAVLALSKLNLNCARKASSLHPQRSLRNNTEMIIAVPRASALVSLMKVST